MTETMAENKSKNSEEKVRVPPDLIADLRRIKGAAQLRGEKPPDFGDLLMDAWIASKSITNSGNPPVTKNSSVNTASGVSLTDDQRDILAMLSEDPERDFLFSSIQTTVGHALEQYRRKWKTKASKPKAPGKSSEPERRSTGTR